MATSLTWNGVTYSIPASGELNWSSLSTFLVALGTSAATSVVQKQAIRVATISPITVVDTTDFAILSNLGTPGAVAVTLPAGVQGRIFAIMDGKGDAATNNITITPNGAETINGAATLVLNHASQMVLIQFIGGDWKVLINSLKPGTIADADIIAAAGIARSKIATGTAYRVLANTSTGAMGENAALTANHVVYADANGQLAGEATLSKSRGGAGADQSSVTYPSTGTIATIAGAQVITNKDIDGGTASDTSRITIPKDTKANLDGLTRKEGTVVYASDTNTLYADDGSVLKAVGSGTGQGELNYVTNPSGSDNVAAAVPTGWANVGDLDIVVTKTSGELPRENLTVSGLKITADANTQSAADYVYFDFTLDDVDLNRILKIQWDQKVLATYTAGQLEVVITTQADRTTAIATPSVSAIPAQDGTFAATFLSGSTATLSLVIRATADMTTGDGICISNVIVGPGTLVQGAAVGDWTSFTPTGSWTTNATYTGTRRRIGDTTEFMVTIAVGGAIGGGPNLSINLPSDVVLDLAKIPVTPVSGTRLFGYGHYYDDSGEVYPVIVSYKSTTDVYVGFMDDTATGVKQQVFSTTAPVTPASPDRVHVKFAVPTVGLSSNIYLGSGADSTSVLNWTAFTPTTGLTGGSSTLTGFYRRVGDSAEIQIQGVWATIFTGGSATFTIPSGLTIDTTKLVETGGVAPLGHSQMLAGGTQRYAGRVHYNNTTSVIVYPYYDDVGASSGYISRNTISTTVPDTWVNNDKITMVFTVPIVGWTAQDYLGKMLTGFSQSTNTKPGLSLTPKQYVAGTAYTNGTPDVTGSETYTKVRCLLVPYQTYDGTWRLRFNFAGTVSSGSRTAFTLTVSGVTFKNTANFYQTVSAISSSSTATSQGYANPNAGTITINHASASTTGYYAAGDVELGSKPTWAD